MIPARLRKIALLVPLAAQAALSFALTVSVSPAEGAAYAPPPDGSGSSLNFFVSGCMDSLFEAGFVVTDTQTDRLSQADWRAKAPVLSEAKEGFVDYMMCVYVEWISSAFHKDALLPASIAYRILRVSDGAVLAEGVLDGIPDSEEASKAVERSASRAGALAAAPFLKLLSALMGGE
jgi:hypothetical protein